MLRNQKNNQKSILINNQQNKVLKFFNRSSIRFKLMFIYLFTIFIIILAIVVLIGFNTFNIFENQINSQLHALGKSKTDQVISLIEQDFERVSLIASRTQMRNSLIELETATDKVEAIRTGIVKILNDALASVDSIRSIDIINLKGIVVASTIETNINQNYHDESEFIYDVNNGSFFSEFKYDENNYYYSIFMPLFSTRDVDSTIIGYIKVDMSLSRLILTLTDKTGLGETGEVLLVAIEDNQLTAISPLRNSNIKNPQLFKSPSIQSLQKLSETSRAIDYRDKKIIMTYYPVPVEGKDWGLIAKVDYDEVMEPYKTLLIVFVFFCLGLSLIGGLLISGGINCSLSNVKMFLEGIKIIGEGDLDYQFDIIENDEIGTLALSFNDMTQKLKSMQKKLKDLGFRDHLTGLYNRRFYEEELKRLNTPRNLPLTILMGDINGLKLINDSFGHDIGDELIIKSAEIISSAFREDDIVARIGGDEFAIILPKTDTYVTEQLVYRIKELLAKEKVAGIDISVSFGYETKNYEKEIFEEVYQKAEEKMYANKLVESILMKKRTIDNIIKTLHIKYKHEEEHAKRVSQLCENMGKALGMSIIRIDYLKKAALLHDIGKIAIDENILRKKEKLTPQEWNEIKRHSEIGYRILSTVNDHMEVGELVLDIHERWDGKGYPRGLKENEILFESRILAIVDAFDAMTNDSHYKSALSIDAAIEELNKNSGLQFDPELVDVFIKAIDAL